MDIINDLQSSNEPRHNYMINNLLYDVDNLLNDVKFQSTEDKSTQNIPPTLKKETFVLPDLDLNIQSNQTLQFILNIANNVFIQLDKGFSESIYHKAMLVDLQNSHYSIETEKIIPILFNNICVGYVKSDIIVESDDYLIIIELKALDREINYKEDIQVKKYMKHINKSKKNIGLVINFPQKNTNDIIQYNIVS